MAESTVTIEDALALAKEAGFDHDLAYGESVIGTLQALDRLIALARAPLEAENEGRKIETDNVIAEHVKALKRASAAEQDAANLRGLLKLAQETVEWWTPDESNATGEMEDVKLNEWFSLRDEIDAALAQAGEEGA